MDRDEGTTPSTDIAIPLDGSPRRRRSTRPPRSFRSLLTLLAAAIHVSSATSAASIASSIDYRYFVAGGSCAALSHGITTPIDVVKTRMQSDPAKYRTLPSATATIVREEGASALVKGLGPTLVGYGVEGSLKFGIYEVAKPLAVKAFQGVNDRMVGRGGHGLGPLPFLIASILAGAAASLVLVPMESVRIRMVTDPDFEGVSLWGGLGRLVEEAGLARTLTVGLGAMLAKQIPYTFGKQVSFDVVAKALYRIFHAPRAAGATLAAALSERTGRPEFVKWAVSVLAAMVASVMACLLSQPGDVILTETYKGGEECAVDGTPPTPAEGGCVVPGERGLGEVSRAIYARSGDDSGMGRALAGFFTGLQARFVHVGVIITSQLVIYDLVKQFLGLPATGSH